MEWTDDGIILGVRRHGESSAIVELNDAQPWPPSRFGAGRRGIADAALAAAR
jgi:hypothetical protein